VSGQHEPDNDSLVGSGAVRWLRAVRDFSGQDMKLSTIVIFLALALASAVPSLVAAEAEAPASPPTHPEETNAQDTLRSYLQLQEQIHATQLQINRNRQESDASAARAAEALANRLQSIEQALAAQRAQELTAMQSSNRVMIIVAGSFAVTGFLAMLLVAYFQWRTVTRLADLASHLPATPALGMGATFGALGPGEGPVVTVGPAERSSLRLLGAMEKLEKRIAELEHIPHTVATEEGGSAHGHQHATEASNGTAAPTLSPSPIASLLGKGQSLLNLEKSEEALACYEEILKLEPNHPEALVKKGLALERLRKLEEAIGCYDRAIAADHSMTMAYLYKGGLYNRMERFSEALQCYEQALQSQEGTAK
jgi:tetratricopeptide (TPR) repeat protein